MVDEKVYPKILEWMEKMSGEIKEIKALLFDHSQKLETLFDVVQEIRDDMKFMKRMVSLHDDEINELKKRVDELSKRLHT